MDRRKRAILILSAILLIAIIVVLSLILRPKKNSLYPGGSEKGSSTSYVAISGDQTLSQVLLPEQLISVERATSNYVVSHLAADVTSAKILPGTTVVNQDGSINFTIQMTPTNKELTVLVQRPSVDLLLFSIVGDTSQPTPLYPFSHG
ncbi:MAG: hypothetical protein ACREGG_02715 [Candidatus Saccharimonadales bacterium]